MKLSDEKFKKILKQESEKHGIELNDNKLEKFLLYKNKIIEYNKEINLTAITDDTEFIFKHFIDCLEIVKYIKEGQNIIDVGTGAGFPGIVISIYFDGKVNITLLDSLSKRVVILDKIIEELNLKNIKTVHGRAEEMAHKIEYREKYDIATARAVADLKVLLEYVSGYIKLGGKTLLLKGNKLEEELINTKDIENVLGIKQTNVYIYSYHINDEEYNRNIIEFIKEKNTNKNYPRSIAKIKKQDK